MQVLSMMIQMKKKMMKQNMKKLIFEKRKIFAFSFSFKIYDRKGKLKTENIISYENCKFFIAMIKIIDQ